MFVKTKKQDRSCNDRDPVLVEVKRFELWTFRTSSECSNQLSYTSENVLLPRKLRYYTTTVFIMQEEIFKKSAGVNCKFK